MAKFKTFVGANRSRGILKEDVQPEIVNFCVPGMLSRCGAGTTWSEQKNCSFAKSLIYATGVCTLTHS